jgi:hypothetical protein
MAGSSTQGNEVLGSLNCHEFFEWLGTCSHLNQSSKKLLLVSSINDREFLVKLSRYRMTHEMIQNSIY